MDEHKSKQKYSYRNESLKKIKRKKKKKTSKVQNLLIRNSGRDTDGMAGTHTPKRNNNKIYMKLELRLKIK